MQIDSATYEELEEACVATTAQPRRRSKGLNYNSEARFKKQRGRGNYTGTHRGQRKNSLSQM
jgi:hypothetical protein